MEEPAVDSADILKRIDELLNLQPTGTVLDANASELLQGCTSGFVEQLLLKHFI
jgi:hypothetical protein